MMRIIIRSRLGLAESLLNTGCTFRLVLLAKRFALMCTAVILKLCLKEVIILFHSKSGNNLSSIFPSYYFKDVENNCVKISFGRVEDKVDEKAFENATTVDPPKEENGGGSGTGGSGGLSPGAVAGGASGQ